MTFDVIFSRLFGGYWIAATVYWVVRFRGIIVSGVVFGTAFMTLGVLGLKGLMTPEWLGVSTKAVNGIMGVYSSYYWRGTPAHTNWPKWTGAVWASYCGLYSRPCI
jgi:hypothetical protein